LSGRGSLQNLILERHALGIVFLQPRFRGVLVRKDLQVILVANLLAGVDVDPDCPCQTLTSWCGSHLVRRLGLPHGRLLD
jgi:hypothetical protein